MFDNLTSVQKFTENAPPQLLKIFAGGDYNPETLKFISQLHEGKMINAELLSKLPGGKGVLSLEGHKVIVELPKSLIRSEQKNQSLIPKNSVQERQSIRVRIETGGTKPSLKIVASPTQQNAINNPETTTNLTFRGKSISRGTTFENFSRANNQVTHAKVVGVIDSKSILVETAGRNYSINVDENNTFKTGMTVRIQASKAGPEHNSSLNPMEKYKSLDLNIIKPYLPARMPVTQMASLVKNEILDSPLVNEMKIKPAVITRLQDTLRILLPVEGEIPSDTKIRQQVELSGINYEAKVRQALESPSNKVLHKDLAYDLKGLLLNLQNSANIGEANKSPTSSIEDFRQTIKYAIDSIEVNQLTTKISKQENQPIVLQIPNPLSPGNKTIQLYIREEASNEEKGSKSKKKYHNIAFFLDLSFLGKIKINAQMGNDQLNVKINVESEAIAGFIRGQAKHFIHEMGDKKIETSVECCVSDKVRPIKDNLIELLVNNKTSLVNIKT